jgi:hypothetical protein
MEEKKYLFIKKRLFTLMPNGSVFELRPEVAGDQTCWGFWGPLPSTLSWIVEKVMKAKKNGKLIAYSEALGVLSKTKASPNVVKALFDYDIGWRL